MKKAAMAVGEACKSCHETFHSGPLSDWVDFDAGRAASHFHGFAFTILEAVVGLHLLAVLFYQLIKHHRLIEAMVTGRQRLLDLANETRPGSPAVLAASLLLWVGTTLLLAS